jgi:hypothetical protein
VLSRIDMGRPFEIHSIRPSLGRDWSGRPRFNWIVEITQGAPLDPADADRPRRLWSGVFRGGTTLVLDAATGKVRYSIRKPVDDEPRRARQRRYQLDGDGDAEGVAALAATYYAARSGDYREPFAMLHRW